MKSRFLLGILALAALSSCTSAYKSGQTPDDVYYSPARPGAEYVEARTDDNNSRRYRNYEESPEDAWLRMRVRNPYRWNAFDNYDFYTPYSWNTWSSPYSYNWNSYWNNYWGWNSYYNPYCSRTVVFSPKTNPVVYNNVRTFSLGGYTNNNYGNTNNIVRTKGAYRSTGSSYNNVNGGSNGSYNNSNNSNTLGNSLKKVFSNNNSGSSGGGYSNGNVYTPSSNDRPSRSYSPSSSGGSSGGSSSSGSSSSGSSGSSGGGVSRPGRGGF